MEMNQIIRLAEQSATGRYIGAGRDKSGPTDGRSILFICIIAPYGSPGRIETHVAGKVRLMYNLMYDLKKVRELYATGTFSQTPANISVESLYTAYAYLVACHITAIGSTRACLRHWFRSS